MVLSPPLWASLPETEEVQTRLPPFFSPEVCSVTQELRSHSFLHGAQPPQSSSSGPILLPHLLCGSLSDSRAAGAESRRGARGKPHSRPNQSMARSPAHPLPAKKNTVIFQKGAKPSMDKAEADGWGGGGGGRHMAKGILRKHTGRVAA